MQQGICERVVQQVVWIFALKKLASMTSDVAQYAFRLTLIEIYDGIPAVAHLIPTTINVTDEAG